jgi:outer membrane protein OmpA-like peptidoglycan-associated protein
MKTPLIINVVLFGALLYAVYAFPTCMVTAAGRRLVASQSPEAKAAQAPPTAAASEEGYCSDGLKTVLRRVLTNCGLIGGGRRGCQPGELRNVAQISDADFNSLFKPLGKRGGIVLFDKEKEDLDAGAKALIEKQWAERRGASYFFIVARASTDGPVELNRALSHKRANSVFFHLNDRFKDPELEKTVGLLWLGEEYAQLQASEFCSWENSRSDATCADDTINRSAILAWIDCRL